MVTPSPSLVPLDVVVSLLVPFTDPVPSPDVTLVSVTSPLLVVVLVNSLPTMVLVLVEPAWVVVVFLVVSAECPYVDTVPLPDLESVSLLTITHTFSAIVL